MSRFVEHNNMESIESLHIFLCGGTSVGKSFSLKSVIEYLKRLMKYHGQNLHQPVVLVTASTGKAATRINGITKHSAFNLTICKLGKQFCSRKPSDEELNEKRYWYKYLNTLMLVEVSVLDKTFEHLNLSLQDIKAMPNVFGYLLY